MKIVLVICLLVFILTELASPDELVERGRKKGKKPKNNNNLEQRVKALERENECKRE